jgi:hypothetical protein
MPGELLINRQAGASPMARAERPAVPREAGFVNRRKQNNQGEEVGGIVPHVTLESIANHEPPKEEVLVDRPERDNKVTRAVPVRFVWKAPYRRPLT